MQSRPTHRRAGEPTIIIGVADRPNRDGDRPTAVLVGAHQQYRSGIANLSCIEPNELNMLDTQNPPSGGAKRKQGRKAGMGNLSRRSVLRTSLAAAAVGTVARPYIANAAATTATVWWTQGFAEEEDISFKKIVAD
jgi:hypothetical protein